MQALWMLLIDWCRSLFGNLSLLLRRYVTSFGDVFMIDFLTVRQTLIYQQCSLEDRSCLLYGLIIETVTHLLVVYSAVSTIIFTICSSFPFTQYADGSFLDFWKGQNMVLFNHEVFDPCLILVDIGYELRLLFKIFG